MWIIAKKIPDESADMQQQMRRACLHSPWYKLQFRQGGGKGRQNVCLLLILLLNVSYLGQQVTQQQILLDVIHLIIICLIPRIAARWLT